MALALIASAALLQAGYFLLIVLALLGAVFVMDRMTATPAQRAWRERRRHAERTARAVRRMSRIKAHTLRQMDEAERRWRP